MILIQRRNCVFNRCLRVLFNFTIELILNDAATAVDLYTIVLSNQTEQISHSESISVVLGNTECYVCNIFGPRKKVCSQEELQYWLLSRFGKDKVAFLSCVFFLLKYELKQERSSSNG